MPSSTFLPPHLERFVRRQIAVGRYHSEDEVIRAALQLLAEAATPDRLPEPRPHPTAADRTRPAARPAPTERWETPGEWRAAPHVREASPAPARRSPRGLLADLRSGINADDIRDARREFWAAFGHDGPA